jgi:hypothetical protein
VLRGFVVGGGDPLAGLRQVVRDVGGLHFTVKQVLDNGRVFARRLGRFPCFGTLGISDDETQAIGVVADLGAFSGARFPEVPVDDQLPDFLVSFDAHIQFSRGPKLGADFLLVTALVTGVEVL